MPFGLTKATADILPSYKTNWGDKSSAEQRRLKRGMTLPEVPEWRIRMHLTTQKSSGNKCTHRAGISVPREESTYAPCIWKMISPPREFTAKARRVVERSTQCKLKHEASRNTKQVEPRSRSKRKAKASGKMRRKQVQKSHESRWKNETKQAKSTKTSQKTSEVEDLRNPETKAAERRVGQQRSPKVYRSS